MLLARAELEIGAEIPGERHLGAGLAAHELGQAAGELAFLQPPERRIEHLGDRQAEHAVAEEFEALIARLPPAERSTWVSASIRRLADSEA